MQANKSKNFQPKHLYKIIEDDEEWYCFGSDLELIPGTPWIRIKKPFSKHIHFIFKSINDSDYYLNFVEPYKSSDRVYSDHEHFEVILSKFKIIDIEIPKDVSWTKRNRDYINVLLSESEQNYKKLSLWGKFKIFLLTIFG